MEPLAPPTAGDLPAEEADPDAIDRAIDGDAFVSGVRERERAALGGSVVLWGVAIERVPPTRRRCTLNILDTATPGHDAVKICLDW